MPISDRSIGQHNKDSNQYRELKKLLSDEELVEVKNKENNSLQILVII